jgi:hypothetical protein
LARLALVAMSGGCEATLRAARRPRRRAVVAGLALASAALLCLSVAAGAAGAAGATAGAPNAGPSVGSPGSPQSQEALRRAAAAAAAAAGTATGAKLKLPNGATTTGPAVGAGSGAAGSNGARTGISSPTRTPPATVYTGPIRPSLLGNGALGRSAVGAKRASAKSGTSTVAIVIGALGALLVLACGAWALARRRAYEPHWWLSLQHSLGEAGYRTSSTWSEFSDWARRGG